MVDYSERSIPPPGGPLGQPPRSDIPPNPNPPIGSVGPNVPAAGDSSAQLGAEGGFGATHVMASPETLEAMPWAGWPVEWATPNGLGGFGSLFGGTAQALDVVFSCIDLNARITADMPVLVTKNLQREVLPPWAENPEPDVYVHWGEFWKQVWWSFQLCGEAFIYATEWYAEDRGTRYPRRFMMLDPWLVDVRLDSGVRTYWVNGTDITDEVLHIRYLSWPNDPRGHGPLEAAGERLLALRALVKYGMDLARAGGVPWGVLQTKFRLSEDQAARIRNQWIASSRRRMGAPAILDNEMTLRELQVNPKDMALTDQLTHYESRVAVLLGVPPYLVGLPSGADSLTYSSTESLYSFHWRSILRPGGRFIIRALSEWTLPRGTNLELDPDTYVRPDSAGRASFYQTMFNMVDERGNRGMTLAEIRTAERLPPLPDAPITPVDPQEVGSHVGS